MIRRLIESAAVACLAVMFAVACWWAACSPAIDTATLDRPAVPHRSTGMQPGTAKLEIRARPGDVIEPSEWVTSPSAGSSRRRD